MKTLVYYDLVASETLVSYYTITRCQNPQDHTFHLHRPADLKYFDVLLCTTVALNGDCLTS
jgi:hypothetical protein